MYKVLIIEDDDRIRKLISSYLLKEQIKVIEAKDGLEGILKFNESFPDLVLLDIMLPKMDGITVCSKLKTLGTSYIIMLTAKSQEEDKLLGYETGADDYVTKPFSPKVLTAKIKAALKRIKDNKDSINAISVSGISIYEASREVYIEEEKIDLTLKEFELLLLLIKNKSIVLSRESILEKLWGYDFEGDLRTVDTTVKRLRQKLSHKAEHIVTIRGIGYKFEE